MVNTSPVTPTVYTCVAVVPSPSTLTITFPSSSPVTSTCSWPRNPCSRWLATAKHYPWKRGPHLHFKRIVNEVTPGVRGSNGECGFIVSNAETPGCSLNFKVTVICLKVEGCPRDLNRYLALEPSHNSLRLWCLPCCCYPDFRSKISHWLAHFHW